MTRHFSFYRILLSLSLSSILLTGCATKGAYLTGTYTDTMRFSGVRYVSLNNFCYANNLNCDIDAITKISTITDGTKTVKIMPDSDISLIDGYKKTFSHEVRAKGDLIYIPPSLASYLEATVFKIRPEVRIVSPYTIRKIVIDAGHGGKDPGAVGRYYKVKEKDVVLDIAKELKKELKKKGNFDIVMTRETDTFISLWKRSDIANKNKADLFISIHANASRSTRPKGFEVYYLSDATDDSARALAAAENEVIAFETNSSDNKPDYLNPTVWDMTLSENRDESIELAKFICNSAKKDLGVRDRGAKSARFYVLKGTMMPAVLVEVGFLSNKQEEWKLRKSSYRKEAAKAIAKGILAYKNKYERTKGFTTGVN